MRERGHLRPTVGVLPGWEVYEKAILLNFLGPLLHGIRTAARDRHCNLLLACGISSSSGPIGSVRPAWPVPSPEVDFVPVGPLNAAGLIVVNPLSEANARYIRGLAAAGHPLVYVGTAEGGPAIGMDNEGGIYQALAHLAGHGHRRIAFIAGSPEDMRGDSGERLRAYRQAARDLGLDADPRLVACGYHIVSGGQSAMQQIIDSGASFTAVLASSDECAIGAMRALRRAGRRIPQDVAVIGFDDQPEAVLQTPPLTTVHSLTFERGYRALEMLLRRIEDGKRDAEIVKVATRLTVRQSCGCLAGATLPHTGDRPAQAALPASMDALAPEFAQAMEDAVLAEARSLSSGEVRALCRRLVDSLMAALERGEPALFRRALDDVLLRAAEAEDDAYEWQIAVSALRDKMPARLPVHDHPAPYRQVEDWLDEARITISESMRRQYRRYALGQRQTADRLALLTAELLAAPDEAQIYQTLAARLPEVGIQHAVVAFYEAQEGDPCAWASLVAAPPRVQAPIRFPSRQFPPAGLYPADAPFSLALLPLMIQGQAAGFVAFDASHLELCGAITQQLAAAILSARMRRHAAGERRPASEAGAWQASGTGSPAHQGPQETILIVDDEPAVLEMYARVVQNQPAAYRVLKAGNGREALERMHRERPDLVLLDLLMPDLDGFGVLEAMRSGEATRDIPVIVLTGQALTARDMERLSCDVATVLEKGLFSVDEILARIGEALAPRRKLGNETRRLIRKAMAYIHEHYAEPVSREDVARHVGVNKDYLTRCFSRETGIPPVAYLTRYRVNQAKTLLAAGEKSVAEVAVAVGFSDSSYFCRVFRQQAGVPPSAYGHTRNRAS